MWGEDGIRTTGLHQPDLARMLVALVRGVASERRLAINPVHNASAIPQGKFH